MTTNGQKAAPPWRLLLVDDEPVVRRGLELLLGQQPGFEICGAAATASEALELVAALTPDLAIVDLNLGEDDGMRLIPHLRNLCPPLKVLVYSTHDARRYAEAALAAGANGYVSKREDPAKLLEAIRRSLTGAPQPAPTPVKAG